MNFLFKEIFGLVFWIMALHRLNDFFCLFARRIGFGFDFCYRLNDFFICSSDWIWFHNARSLSSLMALNYCIDGFIYKILICTAVESTLD